MADLTQGQQTLSSVWGSIQQAVRDPQLRGVPGGVTQYIWEAFKQAAVSRGEVPQGVTIQDVNGLVARASAQARADSELSAAIDRFRQTGQDSAIRAGMFAPDLDSRSLSNQPLGPSYRIRFDTTMLVEGEALNLTYTWEPGIIPPQSVSDLLAGLEEAGAGAAEDYGMEFQGLGGAVSITTV